MDESRVTAVPKQKHVVVTYASVIGKNTLGRPERIQRVEGNNMVKSILYRRVYPLA